MIGLFKAPAVMRLLLRASTAVRLAETCGHREDWTSRVTCCEARALSRATEIAGLFFSAIVSASFTERRIASVGPWRDVLSWLASVRASWIGETACSGGFVGVWGTSECDKGVMV